MPIKKEDQNIIIRWKGGKMKVDAVSQCPSPVAFFMVWGEALSSSL